MDQTPKTRKCRICRGNVEGSCDGVSVTICCVDCCKQEETEEGYTCTTKQGAIREFHCKPRDLLKIGYQLTTNPIDERFAPMYLYLRAEVRCLGERRVRIDKKEKAKRDERKRQDLEKRRKNVFKTFHLDAAFFADDENRILFHCLCGDYLKSTKSKTKFRDVRVRHQVIEQVRAILKSCKGARPDAAFDFCVDHPQAGPAEFQEMKEKVKSVLHIAGHQIGKYLSPGENVQFARLLRGHM